MRLMQNKINTPLEFLAADDQLLRKQVFRSTILGLGWYQRLRGFEVDDFKTHQGQIGRQFVLDKRSNDDDEILSRLQYLSQTSAMKLRYSGLDARGVLVWLAFAKAPTFGGGTPEGFWQNRKMYSTAAFTDQDIFARVKELFLQRPRRTVTAIGMHCYGLVPTARAQTTLVPSHVRADDLMTALDAANSRYGNFTVTYADALAGKSLIKQKIPFGSTQYFELLISGE
jgi:DNA polymerase-4